MKVIHWERGQEFDQSVSGRRSCSDGMHNQLSSPSSSRAIPSISPIQKGKKDKRGKGKEGEGIK